MTVLGLTPDGFRAATTAEIRTDLEAEIRARWGQSLVLGDRSFLGHLVGIVADRCGAAWSSTEEVNSSQDPDKATKTALRALCALTGTFPREATSSSADIVLCGDPGTPVAAGNRVATESTASAFDTIGDVTLLALDAWVATASYSVGDRVTNSSRCYQCLEAGTAAGSGGPTTTDDDIVDGTVHWVYLGEGTAAADGVATSEDTGQIVAAGGDLTVILTPVGGWLSVRNLNDATLGSDEMSDEELRLFREAEIRAPADGSPDSIRARLLALDGVVAASVFFNNTDETVDTDPPHTVEALVRGGDDDRIREILWSSVAAGIRTAGTEIGTVVDSEGNDQTVHFSRPDDVEIYVDITLTAFARNYPGDAAVRTAVAAWGDTLATDYDVIAAAVSAAAFRVAGVLDVPLVKIGTAPSPSTSTTIPISKRQLAVFSPTRITVTSSFDTP
jgi:uncharacterized phage protein gp47/JayE